MRNTTSKLFYSIFFPCLFVLILWGIRVYEVMSGVNLGVYGLYPRTEHGLIGIFTAPLIHGDGEHLLSNTMPLLVLGITIFYFYRTIAFQVFFWIYFITGIWVWVMAREAYHIGASGLIYGFATFIFFSGVLRKDARLLAVSLFVVFLYGSIAWGVFPIKPGMSWESHLMGSFAGIIIAYHFRKEGPPARVYDFGEEEDDAENIEIPDENKPEDEMKEPQHFEAGVNYTYIPKEKEKED